MTALARLTVIVVTNTITTTNTNGNGCAGLFQRGLVEEMKWMPRRA